MIQLSRHCAALATLLLVGCMPGAYQRQVPVLEGPGLADYSVRHGEAGDCLLRRLLPVRYEVQRAHYSLAIIPAAGYTGERLQLELRVGGDDLEARAPGVDLTALDSAEPGSRRYRLSADAEAVSELRIEIHRGGQLLGAESFRLTAERCRALLWKES